MSGHARHHFHRHQSSTGERVFVHESGVPTTANIFRSHQIIHQVHGELKHGNKQHHKKVVPQVHHEPPMNTHKSPFSNIGTGIGAKRHKKHTKTETHHHKNHEGGAVW